MQCFVKGVDGFRGLAPSRCMRPVFLKREWVLICTQSPLEQEIGRLHPVLDMLGRQDSTGLHQHKPSPSFRGSGSTKLQSVGSGFAAGD